MVPKGRTLFSVISVLIWLCSLFASSRLSRAYACLVHAVRDRVSVRVGVRARAGARARARVSAPPEPRAQLVELRLDLSHARYVALLDDDEGQQRAADHHGRQHDARPPARHGAPLPTYHY